jgi:c-di-GMP phosphodiesterase
MSQDDSGFEGSCYSQLPDLEVLYRDLEEGEREFLFILQIDTYIDFNVNGDYPSACIIREQVCRTAVEMNKGKYDIYNVNGNSLAFTSQQSFPRNEILRFYGVLQNCIQYHEVSLSGETIGISTSVGVSFYKPMLFNSAKVALAEAREKNIPDVEYVHRPEKSKEHFERGMWNHKLAKAFSIDQVLPWFQPLENTQTGEVDYFEALARYITPDLDVISAGKFMPMVRGSRISHQMTRIMFKRTLDKFRKSAYRFSFNLDVPDIENDKTQTMILSGLREYHDCSRITFELIENTQFLLTPKVLDFINTIREMGVKIAIDDFGSGYSNYEQVLQVEPDLLKIDGSLVRNIEDDSKSRLLVDHIVKFCETMKMKSVAEHVHNEEVYRIVKEMGVDYAQGHHISPAIRSPVDFLDKRAR